MGLPGLPGMKGDTGVPGLSGLDGVRGSVSRNPFSVYFSVAVTKLPETFLNSLVLVEETVYQA